MKSMSTFWATVIVEPSPSGLLQDQAKMVSAKAKSMPPWAILKPLSIFSRSCMCPLAYPSAYSETVLPVHSAARLWPTRGCSLAPHEPVVTDCPLSVAVVVEPSDRDTLHLRVC